MCDLSGKAPVVHEENVDFPRIFDKEFLKTTWEKVASLKMDIYIGRIDWEGNTGKPFCCFRNLSVGNNIFMRMDELKEENGYMPWAWAFVL